MRSSLADIALDGARTRDRLLTQATRPGRADWIGAHVAVDRGVRVKGRFVDSRIDRLTVERIAGQSARILTGTGLSYASSSNPHDDLFAALRAGAGGLLSAGAPTPVGASPGLDLGILDELNGWLAATDRAARSHDARIRQVLIDFETTRRTIWLGHVDGPAREDDRALSYFTVRAIADDGGSWSTGFFTPATPGPLRDLDPVTTGREVAARAVGGLGARPAPTGELPVVIGGGRGIVLLHEACCHPLEGDEVLRGSAYAVRLGETIAAPGVTIYDDPMVTGAVGHYAFDDEGTPAGTTTLVKDGVLTGFLTDTDTAHRLHGTSSGNGRTASAMDAPIPRMSNTRLAAGPHTPADLIRATSTGIYAEHVGGGEVVEATGQFTFRVTNGFMIRAGELCEPISETTISGYGSDVLRGIDMIADDVQTGAARCGKFGQFVPVGVVGPTMRVDRLTIGGRSA